MKKFFSLVLALAMALSMASFASAEETTTIHIGVIGPMTGAAAVYGLAVARGAEIAVEEINAAGKVNIVLDVQDDENDAEKSINAYNATLDKGTQVILGCVTTTPCIAVSAQAYDERVFMLTPSASSLEVIANKDNAYQVCFTDPAQGSASAEYIFNKKVGEKVAIIYNNADDPGPMGKPGTIYTDPADTEKRGWDPTDPDPANPWDDAFESGTAIRSQAAWDQWETERENWMSSLTPADLQGWSTDSKIAGTRG